jgi:hypothetical protein
MTTLEQILISIFTALATATFAYFGFWRQAQAELRKEYETRFNEKKWGTYFSFTSLVSKLHQRNLLSYSYDTDAKEKQARLDTVIKVEFEKIEPEIWLIGSPKVIQGFIKWKMVSMDDIFLDDEVRIKCLFDLIIAMRSDLGKEKADIDYQVFEGYSYVGKKDKIPEKE